MKDRTPPRPLVPLVDFYNAVSIKHCVTAGAFDLADLEGRGAPLELRMTRQGDTFRALGTSEDAAPVSLGVGELAYAQGSVVLTRQLAWRQSVEGLVTEHTTRAVFVSEILADEDEGQEGAKALAQQVARDLEEGLVSMFQAQVTATIVGGVEGKLSVDLV